MPLVSRMRCARDRGRSGDMLMRVREYVDPRPGNLAPSSETECSNLRPRFSASACTQGRAKHATGDKSEGKTMACMSANSTDRLYALFTQGPPL
jgi:hypothetical protein